MFLAAALSARAQATYLPDERLATDSPLYADAEDLVARYGLPPGRLGLRPWTLAAMESLLVQAERAAGGPPADPAYHRLAPAVRLAGGAGVVRPLLHRQEGTQLLELTINARYEYEDNPARDPRLNRDGRLGLAGALSPAPGAVAFGDLYAGNSSQGGHGTPRFGTDYALVEGQDLNTWLERAYWGFTLGGVRMTAGRDWLRWGPGRTGTLALSDAARALDVFQLETPLLHAARLAWFVAVLDPGTASYLAGHRLELYAGHWSVGLAELARFNGSSQAPLYLMPLVPYSFWEKRVGLDPPAAGDTSVTFRRNNVMWSADVSWTARPGLRLYGEFLLDDYSFGSQYRPRRIAFQGGAHARREVGSGRALGARAEYTRIYNYTYSVWHHHDFEHQGFPLGYFLGPDAEDLSAALSWQPDVAWKLTLDGTWRQKGQSAIGDSWPEQGPNTDGRTLSGVVERQARGGIEVEWTPNAAWRAFAGASYLRLRNRAHVPSPWDRHAPFRLGLRMRW